MLHMLEHAFVHSIEDSIKIVPFLFVTYLVMEYIEHKTNNKLVGILKGPKGGPVLGGIVGMIPQCGMSAMASNFYSGRMITAGTLIAVFLSTSDEMLPIMLSHSIPIGEIGKILIFKAIIAMIAGLLIDLVFKLWKKDKEELRIHAMCEHEHCHCEKGILRSAIHHTINIFIFIVLITFLINMGIEWIGEETLAGTILNHPLVGPITAGIIGLIPNCAASVVITTMYLDGFMSFGTLMAGLLAGAGVGTIVLLRVNEEKKESLGIIGLLYVIGTVTGIVLNLIGV